MTTHWKKHPQNSLCIYFRKWIFFHLYSISLEVFKPKPCVFSCWENIYQKNGGALSFFPNSVPFYLKSECKNSPSVVFLLKTLSSKQTSTMCGCSPQTRLNRFFWVHPSNISHSKNHLDWMIGAGSLSYTIHGTGIFTNMKTIKINHSCRWIYHFPWMVIC